MFRTVPPSIIRSFSLYTQQDQDGTTVPSWFCSQAVSKTVWHIPLLCAQWKTPDDGQRNCPKHVEFYSKNKFEKSVRLFGFIIRSEQYVADFLIRMYFGAPAVCIGYMLLSVNMTLCLSSLASVECLATLCIRVFYSYPFHYIGS